METYQRLNEVAVENEKELLLEVAAGNELAFRKLFHVYWNKVYAVSIDFTKSEPLAEEIVQDVFLKIWLKREYLVSVLKFDDYLFTVARNHIYNVLRKKTAERSFVNQLENHFLEHSNLAEQELHFKETRDLVNKAVELLPAQQRMVFTLSRNEGMDHNQIAEKLGISKLTVKSHMNRALQFIKQFLHKHSDGEFVYFLLFIATIPGKK